MDGEGTQSARFYSGTIVLVAMLWMTVFASQSLGDPIPLYHAVLLFASPAGLIFFSVAWRHAFERARRSWMYYLARRNLVLMWYAMLFVLPALHACAVHHVLTRG